MLRFRKGDMEGAIADLREAVKLDPRNSEYPGRLAAYEERRDMRR